VIFGAHTILYARDADAARAFFRDTLEWEGVDGGGGWLIFTAPPSELAVHPASEGGTAELFLMTDDVAAERARLEARGASFTSPITDQGWGLLTHLDVPGFGPLGLYQPRHPSPLA
jgi:catechol 2,3-dioxygenase-like lactoylglutathione lyase family enzyme